MYGDKVPTIDALDMDLLVGILFQTMLVAWRNSVKKVTDSIVMHEKVNNYTLLKRSFNLY